MKKPGNISTFVKSNTENLLLVVMLFLFLPLVSGQEPGNKPSRQTAMEEFNSGKYEEALELFNRLNSAYPRDPLYKYYLGACLVRLEKDPEKARVILAEAIRESAAIRPVPPEAHYYLGRSLQLSGRYQEAIKSYEKFTELAGKKEAREMKVPELVRQCEDRKGSITTIDENRSADQTVKPAAVIAGKEKAVTESVVLNETKIRDSDMLSEKYDTLLNKALMLEVKSDSAMTLAVDYREKMLKAEGSARLSLRAKASEMEGISKAYRKEADTGMSGLADPPVPGEKDYGKLPGPEKNQVQIMKDNTRPVTPDTIKKNVTVISDKKPVVKADTIKPIKKQEEEVKLSSAIPVFADFSIMEKPDYKPGEKVIVDPLVPGGLVYRIQVAVFKNPVAPAYFKGMIPVHGFRNPSSGLTTYYAGMFRRSSDAGKSLVNIRSLGFKDAYVVPFTGNKVISVERATILEKEWGDKPLFEIKEQVRDTPADTVPQVLMFRVEVRRSLKPLPKEEALNIEKIAEAKGLDVLVNDKKEHVYLIGKFFTYNSASEFADLLIRNGFRDAKVAAYIGTREIPVETARSLFEDRE